MADRSALEGILDLAKAADELKNSRVELDKLKSDKAQLEREINLLKKIREDEQKKFESERKENNSYAGELKSKISELEGRRNTLSASLAPEVSRLQNLHDEAKSVAAQAIKEQEKTQQVISNLSKVQKDIEDKKEIIKQIKGLADKL